MNKQSSEFQMISNLVFIRLQQLKRELTKTGWLYSLILLVITGLLGFLLYHVVQNSTHSFYLAALMIVSVYTIHSTRNDLQFIRQQLRNPFFILTTEYILLALPVIILLFLKSYFIAGCTIIAGCILIALIVPKNSTHLLFPKLARWIPSAMFEWLSGIRNTKGIVAVFLIVLYATCFLKFIPLIFLWLTTITIAGFYQFGEPLSLLYLHENAKQLLRIKIKNVLLLYVKITLIPVLVNIFLHPDIWWVDLMIYILCMLVIICAVLIKYAVYRPNERLTAGSMLLSIVSISPALPFTLPLPIIVAAIKYKSAIQNLENYFHDQHK
ncbi:MAG TPA: hypothetical protein PLU85_02300 [Bacteroidia bacterium]|nr:hypothetical protein [Bacteroidia bacterium]QQR96214.1 MAG: hypothetical protein IPJ93_06170 [Bacteroidota bacterium]MBP8668390.1 hypothetical protein [Bacteroidia bacterium]HQX68745.1 hypothetical protein [Bacteroidia bacterium]HQZ77146.1 hypothetical protein [Bacteroidia bacterium]